jgi:uncharacterized protein (DUF1800 family)
MKRRISPGAGLVILGAICISQAVFAQPVLTRVVSRMGAYDVALPQTGAGGIECRSVSAGLSIVVSFDRAVNGGTAAVSAGTATVGAPTFNGNAMTVPLTGVANPQAITLTLSNVTDTLGGTLASQDIFFRVIEGDVNGSGTVTVSDVNLVKYAYGAVNKSTFRSDLTHDGTIGASDLALVKARVNTGVGGAAVNTPPTISDIADQSTAGGVAMTPVTFTIGDGESDPATLNVTATSSDTTLVPNANISITGADANRTIAITPALDGNGQPRTGTATITVTVSDGLMSTNDTFLLAVGSPSKVYVAVLTAEDSSTVTSGSGSATLIVDPGETQAILRFSYNNLTTNKTAEHIHGPADPGQVGGILFDIDASTPQQDGSYLWTFAQTGNTTVQDIIDALHAGRLYLNIHTSKYPDGEIRGHFQYAAGSITFTPPPPPPPLPSGPPTDQDAARFLIQATFGPAPDDTTDSNQTQHTIAWVKQVGYSAWLDAQLNTPTTSMKSIIENRIVQPNGTAALYTLDGSNITDVFWYLALKSPDQLRQRVALALSEIFVVSKVEETINGEPLGVASYHDTLANDAFGNFRTLLKEVTLHPIMGQYLNMRGNKKQATPTSPPPNENYAREVLQLFSVGLNNLHPDGTLKFDATGLPIPTYDQSTIQNFARVFTGWDAGTAYNYSFWDATLVPPGVNSSTSNRSYYVRPMTVSSGNHDFNSKVLLNGQVSPALSASTTNANNELDLALDNIFNHPNVGPFICRRLIQRLVTSNPTPAYIYRVSEVFRDNGQGVRGDLKAVVRAILTDYEARTTDLLGNEGYGRLKEPILRLSQVIRASHPFSNGTTSPNTQFWRLGSSDSDLLQTPYRSPTVFNFFDPGYAVALQLTNPKNGLKYTQELITPEMQIANENTVINTANLMKRGVVDGGSFVGTSDVRLSLATEQGLAGAAAGDNLVAYLNKTLMAGQMPANMQTTLKAYYSSTSNVATRARGLVYLVAASPQFATQK